MRVTKKWLTAWINERLKITLPGTSVMSIDITHYTQNQIENGAYALSIPIKDKDGNWHTNIFSHSRLSDLSWYLNNGMELYIDWERNTFTKHNDITLEVKKIL